MQKDELRAAKKMAGDVKSTAGDVKKEGFKKARAKAGREAKANRKATKSKMKRSSAKGEMALRMMLGIGSAITGAGSDASSRSSAQQGDEENAPQP